MENRMMASDSSSELCLLPAAAGGPQAKGQGPVDNGGDEINRGGGGQQVKLYMGHGGGGGSGEFRGGGMSPGYTTPSRFGGSYYTGDVCSNQHAQGNTESIDEGGGGGLWMGGKWGDGAGMNEAGGGGNAAMMVNSPRGSAMMTSPTLMTSPPPQPLNGPSNNAMYGGPTSGGGGGQMMSPWAVQPPSFNAPTSPAEVMAFRRMQSMQMQLARDQQIRMPRPPSSVTGTGGGQPPPDRGVGGNNNGVQLLNFLQIVRNCKSAEQRMQLNTLLKSSPQLMSQIIKVIKLITLSYYLLKLTLFSLIHMLDCA